MIFKRRSPEELKKIEGYYDYMKTHPEKYSPASNEDRPFHHTILPEKTLLKLVPEAECSTFPEEWVPHNIQIVRSPVFMSYSIKDKPEAKYIEPSKNMKVDPNLGTFEKHPHTVKLVKIWERDWDFRKPLLSDHDRFEEVIKNAFDILLKYKSETEKQIDQSVNMFFLGFLESRRVNQFGYLPNEVMLAARITKFARPVQ